MKIAVRSPAFRRKGLASRNGSASDACGLKAGLQTDFPQELSFGTELKLESRTEGDRLVVWRLPEIEAINDKEGKPIGIDRQIGKRPIFVAGNVGNYGDVAMMQYSKGRRGPSFQLLINHDDAAREFAYGEKDNGSLNEAKKYSFTVVSVKNDWKTVFVARQAAAAK